MTISGYDPLVTFVLGGGLVQLLNVLVSRSNTKRTLAAQSSIAMTQQITDRRLALDNLVFHERSKAYLDAVSLLQDLQHLVHEPPDTAEEMEKLEEKYTPEVPRDLVSRLTVYASAEAANLFSEAYRFFHEALRHAFHRENGYRQWRNKEAKYWEIEELIESQDRMCWQSFKGGEERYEEFVRNVQETLAV